VGVPLRHPRVGVAEQQLGRSQVAKAHLDVTGERVTRTGPEETLDLLRRQITDAAALHQAGQMVDVALAGHEFGALPLGLKRIGASRVSPWRRLAALPDGSHNAAQPPGTLLAVQFWHVRTSGPVSVLAGRMLHPALTDDAETRVFPPRPSSYSAVGPPRRDQWAGSVRTAGSGCQAARAAASPSLVRCNKSCPHFPPPSSTFRCIANARDTTDRISRISGSVPMMWAL
jgi:hypothetical protein